MTVVICFFLCWSPYHSQRLMFATLTLTGGWTSRNTYIHYYLYLASGKWDVYFCCIYKSVPWLKPGNWLSIALMTDDLEKKKWQLILKSILTRQALVTMWAAASTRWCTASCPADSAADSPTFRRAWRPTSTHPSGHPEEQVRHSTRIVSCTLVVSKSF